jgi:DNA-binding FadR family transcriptional regulator
VFHQRLVDAAHNPALSELYRYFSAIVGAQLRQTLNISPRRQAVFDLHTACSMPWSSKTRNAPNPFAGS